MSKKPKRGAPAIDMTAMVDVAFLLLTFFILTTTSFREEAPLEVEMASSVSQTEVPPHDLATVSIGDSGQVFLGFVDISARQEVLRRAIEKFQWKNIPESGMQYFTGVQDFGVPISQIPRWLAMTGEERKAFKQPGMSAVFADSVKKEGNDLREWIYLARMSNPRMRFAIKGDVDAHYEEFQDVIATLQDWDINQFALITDLEKGEEEKKK